MARTPRDLIGPVLLGGLWVLASVVSLVLRSLAPPYPIFESLFDDEMQVFLADSIAHGQWLGEWTQRTLSKGPGYPVFLALVHDLGMNPMMAAQVVYLAGASVAALGLLGITRSRWLAGVLYGALALNPAMLGAPASRVYRESLTGALAMVVLGLVLTLAWLVVRPMQMRWRVPALAIGALGLGVSAAWLTLTRIDTMWILVAVIPIVVASVFWGTSNLRERAIHALSWVGAAAVTIALVVAISGAVASRNQQTYGVRVTDDFSAGAFAEMSNAWASVHAGPPRSYVPISAAQRAAVYAISPTAAALASDLDSRKEFFGESASCAVAGICDDYAGGWMPWAMRVAAGKRVDSAAEFQAMFAQIRDDITAACSDGRLQCGARGLGPGVPPLADIDRGAVMANLQRVFREGYVGFAPAALTGSYVTTDDPQLLAVWARTVADIPNLVGNPPPWISPSTMKALTRIRGAYSTAATILTVPAILGLLWALLRPLVGRRRPPDRTTRAAVVGTAALAACAAHAGLLAVWSAGTGAPTGEEFYLIASVPFFIVAVTLGTWCLIVVPLGGLQQRLRATQRVSSAQAIAVPTTVQPTSG